MAWTLGCMQIRPRLTHLNKESSLRYYVCHRLVKILHFLWNCSVYEFASDVLSIQIENFLEISFSVRFKNV